MLIDVKVQSHTTLATHSQSHLDSPPAVCTPAGDCITAATKQHKATASTGLINHTPMLKAPAATLRHHTRLLRQDWSNVTSNSTIFVSHTHAHLGYCRCWVSTATAYRKMNHTTTTRYQLLRLYIPCVRTVGVIGVMHITRALPSQCHVVAATCCCQHIPQHTPGKATPQDGVACIQVPHARASVLRVSTSAGTARRMHTSPPPHCHHTHCAPP